MEIFHQIWQSLVVPNESLINVFSIPLSFIETFVIMLFFTTVLNIQTSKKQKFLYVFTLASISSLMNIFMPRKYCVPINMLLSPILVILIFKTNILKGLSTQILAFIVSALLETLIVKLYLSIFNLAYNDISVIPIYRLISVGTIYLAYYFLFLLVKYCDLNIKLFDNITNKKSKHILILNLILALLSIITQFILVSFYSEHLPLYITVLNSLTLLSYTFISIYSLVKSTKLEVVSKDLEETRLYNKTLNILHDNIRGFKHDFGNIVQAIGGYVDSNDIDGLKKYYSQLLEDCQRVNNLTSLNPSVINNPAIYSILASKYYKADELGIKIDLEVFLDLNNINMKIYEFTRILGILLDNAIEAASCCNEKVIHLTIRKDFKSPRQLLIIENTYSDKDVDTEKIYQKGYTTKQSDTKSHGLGLWKVRQILQKSQNLNLFTTKDDTYFRQQLEIYI